MPITNRGKTDDDHGLDTPFVPFVPDAPAPTVPTPPAISPTVTIHGGLRYIGKDTAWPDLPTRDLTAADIRDYALAHNFDVSDIHAALIASKLYREE